MDEALSAQESIFLNIKDPLHRFIHGIPKAELHVHIEGTLEPKLMFDLAKRNNVALKYKTIDEVKEAYQFHNLQSFLDIYYEGANVLITEQDFFDMTLSYLQKLNEQNVLHAEIFFDPQTHTERGVSFDTVISGINKALDIGREKYKVSTKLIMCFLRHLSEESAFEILEEAKPFKNLIHAVGLDSSELGNPPSKFLNVFKAASDLGYVSVAHAGEEGPPEYIWEAIEKLRIKRIDHGVRCLEDLNLICELITRQIPLTVCPLSNIKLAVFNDMKSHNIKELMKAGLIVTVNSDDPAYFGGYVAENYLAVCEALQLSKDDIYTLAKNSFLASFLSEDEKNNYINRLDNFVNSF
ncbi:MAG: adenosine deaminase [Candidatus Melainabacteria bacterium]|nr:adenosine deaminase [Candidatus Melainabacteria bacterium]